MRASIVFASVVALGAVVVAPTQAARRRPDLKAGGVVGPNYTHPGGVFSAHATVAAVRGARASTLRFYLSAKPARAAGDIPLGGAVKVRKLATGRRVVAYGTESVPGKLKLGSYYLLACADDLKAVSETNERNNCSAAARRVTLTDTPMTTRQLVNDAVAQGKITAETGLVYRAYAAFGDKRVPRRYLGDDRAIADDGVMSEVAQRWTKLSPAARRNLARFFYPPAAAKSWANPRAVRSGAAAATHDDPCDTSQVKGPDWTNVSAAGGKVRVWYQKSYPADAQQAVFTARDIGTAYTKFKTLLGREPKSDASSPCYHGSDGALDIYLVYSIDGSIAETIPSAQNSLIPSPCSNTSAFIVVRTQGGKTLHQYGAITRELFAHELFHAFQMAFAYKYSCASYLSWDEAAATWGAHYAFPTDDWEHIFANWLWYPEKPLYYYPELSYDHWIFPLFIEKALGASVIRTIYEKFGSMNALEAVNSSLPGGFKKQWPLFTRYGWNQDPVHEFHNWDRLDDHPMGGFQVDLPVSRLQLAGQKASALPLPAVANDPAGPLPSLSRKYYPLAVVDQKIRYLRFKNTLASNPDASVQAIVTFADGHYEFQNWTGRNSVEFCRDKASEDVTDLVVMYGNTDWTQSKPLRVAEQPSLKFADECVPYRYKILNVNFMTTAAGTSIGGGVCDLATPPIVASESRNFSGGMTAQPAGFPSAFTKGFSGYDGQITADTASKWSNEHVDTCQFTMGGDIVPCSYLNPENSPADPFAVDFSIRGQSLSPGASVTGWWGIPQPEIGWASGGPPTPCFIFDYSPSDVNLGIQQQPASKFTDTGPQTISISGSEHFSNTSFVMTQSLDYTWTFSLTFVRVDQDGKPML